MSTTFLRPSWRGLPLLAAFLLFVLASSAYAQAEADPPGRVAFVSARQGSVVFAPDGEEDWVELPQNRPLTAGDRLWSDRGARVELQLGAATLHVDGESHLGISDLDERAAQFIVQQGSVNARVRELTQGENFEIDTPNVAVRALQPGDYRVDVDAQTGQTRVVVNSGLASVFGEGGHSVQIGAGQHASFAGRHLARVQAPHWRQDDFGAWAADRNRQEDQSISARYVPRGVVGYSQLDQHGTWSQDPQLGAVWYPQVVVQDWAPYRYGHWAWVQPWGWTWVDDAPWGFAPFHYGRWTMIGHRWAWVPGRLAARPVYSPALVVFVGGHGSSFSFQSGGPGVGWYPLAPGEAWWPWYRTSPRYVNFANFNINLTAYPRHHHNHVWRQRPHALTVVREDDFRRARPVHRHWMPVQPHMIGAGQVGVTPPQRPEVRRERERDRDRREMPRLHATPPAAVQPAMPSRVWGRDAVPPAVVEQHRAAREQERLQRQAERDARQQIREGEHQRRFDEPRRQQEQVFRPQLDLRQQQEQQEREIRRQRDQLERSQREGWQHRQQERGEPPRRHWEQPRSMLPQQQVAPAAPRPQVQMQRERIEERRAERQERREERLERREERRMQRDDGDGGRGRGQGGQRAGDDDGRGRGHGGWQRGA